MRVMNITPKGAGAKSLNFTFGGLGAFNLGGAGPSVSVPDQNGNIS